MRPFRRIKLTQRSLDSLFDIFILITSISTLLFVILLIVPIIILFPDFWLRPLLELLVLGYFGIKGLYLWKKEVE